jgi:hypothetical protein
VRKECVLKIQPSRRTDTEALLNQFDTLQKKSSPFPHCWCYAYENQQNNQEEGQESKSGGLQSANTTLNNQATHVRARYSHVEEEGAD